MNLFNSARQSHLAISFLEAMFLRAHFFVVLHWHDLVLFRIREVLLFYIKILLFFFVHIELTHYTPKDSRPG